MKYTILFFTAILILLSSCTSTQNKNSNNPEQKSTVNVHNKNPNLVIYPTLNDSLHRALMIQGGTFVHRAMFGIKTALADAIMEKGGEYAVGFCNVNAIPITDSLSEIMNVEIKRVAKKNRNPQNLTNEAENDIYKQYIMGYLQSQPPRARVEINKSGHPVYYKLIDVKAECMMCHGKINVDIAPSIAARIKQLYPNDKATDFEVGEPRGMWTITFNDILIKTE